MAKHDVAGGRRKSAQPKPVPKQSDEDAVAEAAFDLWLNRGLHQLYDDVAREPIPDELLRIIEADRSRTGAVGDGTINGEAEPSAAPADTTAPPRGKI
jgi:hypothetical protein